MWKFEIFQVCTVTRLKYIELCMHCPVVSVVKDDNFCVSGGCGSMYEIWIDSEQFSGKRLLQQHRMVNEVST